MSTWTHVVGAIRVEGLYTVPNRPSEAVKILGKLFDSPDSDMSLPDGSEGSLQWDFLQNDDRATEIGVILIWGDLRDYTDVLKIREWFSNVLEFLKDDNNKIYSRQAVLTASCENGDYVSFNDEAGWSFMTMGGQKYRRI